MSATPIVYSSLDASSPAIDGLTTANLNVWARAVLVNGYGAKSPAGWTEPFATAGGVAAFRNNSVAGSGSYLRIDDSGSGTGGTREALVRAYKTMSDLNTGTDPTPMVSQLTSGLVVRKSSALSSSARSWWAIANRKWFYLFVDSNGADISAGRSHGFCLFAGDLQSIRPGDAYNFFVAAGVTQNATTRCPLFNTGVAVNTTTISSGAYLMRNYAQSPNALLAWVNSSFGVASVLGGASTFAYPHEVNNGAWVLRVLVSEGGNRPRGFMPNCYAPHHDKPYNDLTSLPDIPSAGITGIAKTIYPTENTSANAGQLIFDTTSAD
jgi:hypothetical protein